MAEPAPGRPREHEVTLAGIYGEAKQPPGSNARIASDFVPRVEEYLRVEECSRAR